MGAAALREYRTTRRRAAFHEAGHAVVALLLGCGVRRLRLIEPSERPNGLGEWRSMGCCTLRQHPTKAEDERIMLAGLAAEHLAGYDMPRDEWRHWESHLPEVISAAAVREVLANLQRHWQAVEAIAEELLDRHRLPGRVVERMFDERADQ